MKTEVLQGQGASKVTQLGREHISKEGKGLQTEEGVWLSVNGGQVK